MYVSNALSPSEVLEVIVNEEDTTTTVIVPDHQLSLAIGKRGQNAHLAAKLTGWKIDIKSASVAQTEGLLSDSSTMDEEPSEEAMDEEDDFLFD